MHHTLEPDRSERAAPFLVRSAAGHERDRQAPEALGREPAVVAEDVRRLRALLP